MCGSINKSAAAACTLLRCTRGKTNSGPLRGKDGANTGGSLAGKPVKECTLPPSPPKCTALIWAPIRGPIRFLPLPNSVFMNGLVSSAIGHFRCNAAGTKASKCLLISRMLQPSLCPRSLNKVGAGDSSGRNGRLRGRGGNGSECMIWERPGKSRSKTPHLFFPMPLAKASCHAQRSTIHSKPKQKAAMACIAHCCIILTLSLLFKVYHFDGYCSPKFHCLRHF